VVSAKQLEQVRRRALEVEAAESALRAAIAVASESGASLREIALVAGRSHEHVRKIINEQEGTKHETQHHP
jgi:hypothetical protein